MARIANILGSPKLTLVLFIALYVGWKLSPYGYDLPIVDFVRG
jgi:hypothetical protein